MANPYDYYSAGDDAAVDYYYDANGNLVPITRGGATPITATPATDTMVNDQGQVIPTPSAPSAPAVPSLPSVSAPSATPVALSIPSTAAPGPISGAMNYGDEMAAGYTPYAQLDEYAIQKQVQDMAKAAGVAYDPSDLADVFRAYYNSGPQGGQGGNLQQALAIAQAKFAQRASNRPGGGGGSSSGANWFSANAPSGGTSTFGGTPERFGETYQPLARPSTLGTYTPGTFVAPTMADLENDPGYLASQAAMQRGLERSAAARGSLRTGGFLGRALPRALSENAYAAYQNLYGRKAQEFGQRETLGQGARAINEGAYQSDLSNALTGYNTRYRSYLDYLQNKRQSEQDTWNRNMDLARLGYDATTAGRPMV